MVVVATVHACLRLEPAYRPACYRPACYRATVRAHPVARWSTG
ncbi:hypothetical protein [Nonomuraea sp. NPDC050786]